MALKKDVSGGTNDKQNDIPNVSKLTSLNLLTWNLQDFGSPKDADDVKQANDQYSKSAAQIKGLVGITKQYDIAIFEEIADRDEHHQWTLLNADLKSSGYVSYPDLAQEKNRDPQHHNTMIMYNKNKLAVTETIDVDVIDQLCGNRVPSKHRIIGGRFTVVDKSIDPQSSDILIIGVHLKNPKGGRLSIEKRDKQIVCVQAIIQHYTNQYKHNRVHHYIVAGDFNFFHIKQPLKTTAALLGHIEDQHPDHPYHPIFRYNTGVDAVFSTINRLHTAESLKIWDKNVDGLGISNHNGLGIQFELKKKSTHKGRMEYVNILDNNYHHFGTDISHESQSNQFSIDNPFIFISTMIGLLDIILLLFIIMCMALCFGFVTGHYFAKHRKTKTKKVNSNDIEFS